MAKRTLSSITVLALQVLLLTSCFLFGPRKPLIVWENFDFNDGLGNQLAAPLPSFVGTPIEGGASVWELCVHTIDNVKTIWGLSTAYALVRSDDAAESWQVIEDSLIGDLNGPVKMRYDSNGFAWTHNSSNVLRSTDDGASWICVYRGPPGIQSVGFQDLEVQASAVYLVSADGALTKIDRSTLHVTEIYRASSALMDVMCAQDGLMYISTVTEILVSADGGVSFSHFSDVDRANDLTEVNGNIFCTTNGHVVEVGADGSILWSMDGATALSQYPFFSLCSANEHVYALSASSSGNYLVKIDALHNYMLEETDLGGSSVAGDVYLDTEGVLYIGLSGRVLISYDGGATIEEHPFGLSAVNVIQSKYGQTWAGIPGSSAAFYQPESSYWQSIAARLNCSFQYIECVTITSPTHAILAGGGVSVVITSDAGNTFKIIPFGPDNESSVWAQSVARDSHGTTFLLVSFSEANSSTYTFRIYRSDDQGESWSFAAEFCPTENAMGRGTLVIDENRACMWAAVDPYHVGLYQGDLQGKNWVQLDIMGFDMLSDACLDASGNLYIVGHGATGIGIYQFDLDAEWSYIPNPQGIQSYSRDFIVDEDGCFWLATEIGLFYSPNGGSSWIQFTKEDGLASNIVNSVSVEGQGIGKIIWVGTALGASCGVFAE